MINKKLTGCLVALMLGSGTGLANSRYIFYAVNDSTNEQSTTAKTNDKENQKATKDKEKPSSYEQLIKKGGSVNDGLFTIRHIEDKWYYELPDSILGRYLLAVTRFTAVPQNFGKFSGEAINQKTLYFEQRNNNTINLRAYVLSQEADPESRISRTLKASTADQSAWSQ